MLLKQKNRLNESVIYCCVVASAVLISIGFTCNNFIWIILPSISLGVLIGSFGAWQLWLNYHVDKKTDQIKSPIILHSSFRYLPYAEIAVFPLMGILIGIALHVSMEILLVGFNQIGVFIEMLTCLALLFICAQLISLFRVGLGVSPGKNVLRFIPQLYQRLWGKQTSEEISGFLTAYKPSFGVKRQTLLRHKITIAHSNLDLSLLKKHRR